jgi:hypothetical protein
VTASLAEALGQVSTGPFKAAPTNKGQVDLTTDGGQFKDVVVDQQIADDWTPVFSLFQLDPGEFEVAGDTVKMSTWQQSASDGNGGRDIIQLWSYSARFTRKPKERLPIADIEEMRAALRAWKPPRRRPKKVDDSAPCTALINLADIQGGKSEGGGVKATSQRLTDGLENTQEYLERVRKYRNVCGLALANLGDPIEGCAGNYATQLFSVELDLRGQMNFILDHWTTYARTLFPMFDEARFISVLCNHGEFSRLGTNKNQTTDHDNAGGFLAETLQRILSGRNEFDHVQWTIPHDEMNVFETLSGVPMAFNHGHKVTGNGEKGFETWKNGQLAGNFEAFQARIWQTAHKHHFAAWDLGSATVFQAPSLDGGSKWLKDMTGKYSNSGILTYLVGEHAPLGWSDLAFL